MALYMIKLVCIESDDNKGSLLTTGKVYYTKGGPPAMYEITCDDGTKRFFSQRRFISPQEYRDTQLDTLGI